MSSHLLMFSPVKLELNTVCSTCTPTISAIGDSYLSISIILIFNSLTITTWLIAIGAAYQTEYHHQLKLKKSI